MAVVDGPCALVAGGVAVAVAVALAGVAAFPSASPAFGGGGSTGGVVFCGCGGLLLIAGGLLVRRGTGTAPGCGGGGGLYFGVFAVAVRACPIPVGSGKLGAAPGCGGGGAYRADEADVVVVAGGFAGGFVGGWPLPGPAAVFGVTPSAVPALMGLCE